VSSDPERGEEVQGRVLSWLEPSSFEIAAMAKFKTMVPEKVYDAVVWERETNAMGMLEGLDPEAHQLYEQIRQDRVEVLKKAILERRLKRRQDP
jgi:hypothetical protein